MNKTLYNLVMKRFFILLLCLVFLLSFSACSAFSDDNSLSSGEQENVQENEGNDNNESSNDNQEQNEQIAYAVSTTSSLRIRSKPLGSSTVLGYLDKNDALVIRGEEGDYYKTVYKEKTAYVHKNYCKTMSIKKANDKVEKAMEIGSSLLGYPYVWGSQRYHWGNGVKNKNFVMGEFDCSAFVQYVYYQSNGVLLDLTTRTQVNNGWEVQKSQIQRGDLMFFTNSSRKNKKGVERIGHVAIYLGDNYILHTASDHAVIEPISALRWSYYICTRRVVN